LHDKSEDASVVAAVKAHLAIKAKANARAKAQAKAKSKAELDAHLKDSGGKSFVDDKDDDDVRGDRRQRRLQASEGLPPPKTKPSAGFLGSVGGHGLSVGAAKKEMTPYEKKLSDIRAAWFINAQWALGAEGTGAPVHYHNTAWNALLYGAKKWMLYKPRDMIMSNRQILEYTETDLVTFATDADATGIGEKVSGSRSTLTLLHLRTLWSSLSPVLSSARPLPLLSSAECPLLSNTPHTLHTQVTPTICVQQAGDVVIVPEAWGHGVLNLQESVAVATEMKVLFRYARNPASLPHHYHSPSPPLRTWVAYGIHHTHGSKLLLQWSMGASRT
jgi:hypothetical protein